MSWLIQRKEAVRISTRLLLLVIIFIVMAFVEFLILCLSKVPDTSYVSAPREMTLGNTFSCEPYAAVQLTIKDINDDNGSCLAVVQSITDNSRRQGWVKAGEPITFAEDLLGQTGIYIERIEKEKVSVVFLCKPGRPRYRFSLPWK
ncbi:MAG: hypothetical protein JW749_00215 [Sedimentisphaerales bacterium]|nr:hypothetical protein [Sedimentisphaerales bacterium]